MNIFGVKGSYSSGYGRRSRRRHTVVVQQEG